MKVLTQFLDAMSIGLSATATVRSRHIVSTRMFTEDFADGDVTHALMAIHLLDSEAAVMPGPLRPKYATAIESSRDAGLVPLPRHTPARRTAALWLSATGFGGLATSAVAILFSLALSLSSMVQGLVLAAALTGWSAYRLSWARWHFGATRETDLFSGTDSTGGPIRLQVLWLDAVVAVLALIVRRSMDPLSDFGNFALVLLAFSLIPLGVAWYQQRGDDPT